MQTRASRDRPTSASAADANRLFDVDLRRSLFVLATLVAISLVGLAVDGNWPKILRVVSAATVYIAIPLARELASAAAQLLDVWVTSRS